MSMSRVTGVAELGSLVVNAARLNLAAAVRTRRQGYSAWVGAVNTDYDPLDPETAAQPFDMYAALHRGGRLHYNPRRATWILHQLDDVRGALRDTDQVTSSEGVTRMRFAAPVVALTDDAQHAQLRKQAMPGFTAGALESWRQKIDELAAELVGDVIADPGCDVVQKLAIPLPMKVIAYLLGVPDKDIKDFRRWSEEGVRILEFTPTGRGITQTAKSVAAVFALRRYFLRHFASGGLNPDTVLGRLVAHNQDGDLSHEELFLIAMVLLIAGNETTTNLLAGMFDTFAQNPDQYDMIRANPDLIPSAVEEQLRFSSPIQNTFRFTRADYPIGEIIIPKGSRVLLSFGAANRDPRAFPDPNEYRADRNPRTHVGFGYGAHMCIGAPLARMEAQAVLRELVERVPRICSTGKTAWSTHISLRGPTQVPIRLESA